MHELVDRATPGPRAFSAPSRTVVRMLKTASALFAVALLTSCGTQSELPPPVPSSCPPSQTAPPGEFDNRLYPELSDLPDYPGSSVRIEVSGTVRASDCTPLADVQVRFSAAAKNGEYTDVSYGSVRTDRYGRFRFTTPFPGVYAASGNTPHVHMSARIGPVELRDEVRPDAKVSKYQIDLVVPKTSAPARQIP